MAKKRKRKKKATKGNPSESAVWSRRSFIVATSLGVAGLGLKVYGTLSPAPPVQVIVMPPAPVQVAQAVTIPLEAGAYLTVAVSDATLTHEGAADAPPGATSV